MFRFFKDFIVYGFAAVLGKVAMVFLIPIYTNILTKEEYGTMALITSCKGIVDLLSNLNIHSGIARDYYEYKDDRRGLVSTGFVSILCCSLIILLFAILSERFWLTNILNIDLQYKTAFTLMLLSIPAGSMMSYFSILTRFNKKAVLYSIGNLMQLSLQIGISVYGVVVMRAGIVSVFAGLLLSELFAVIYFACLNHANIKFDFKWFYLKRALLFSLPTLPAILAGWVDSSVGQIMIGRYISVADLGVYSIALSIISVFTLISVALHNVWSPFLYENYLKPSFKADVYRLFIIIVMGLMVVGVQLSLFSREIILLLTNPSYLNASRYLTVLILPMCIYLLFPFVSSGVSISRDTKYIGYSYILGSMLNLIMLFLVIKRWGIISVPLCLLLSRLTTFLYLKVKSEKRIDIDIPLWPIFMLGISITVCYIIVINDIPLSARIGVSVCMMLVSVITLLRNCNISFVTKFTRIK